MKAINRNIGNLHDKVHNNRGFSMMELVAVLAIMGILLGMLIPLFPNAKKNESEIALRAYATEIEEGLKQYYIIYGTQISQSDDASETVILSDNQGLNTWMTRLNTQFEITFRGGYTYQYENKGLFGAVTIKESD